MQPVQSGSSGGMKFLSEYSPDEPVPLGGYAGLTAVWAGAAATFVISRRRSGRPFPDRVPVGDLALLTAALPFTILEAAFRAGSTIMIEARIRP